ncbi:MAG: hypothetical protein AAF657_18110 [Acidobacteriota bacterium]
MTANGHPDNSEAAQHRSTAPRSVTAQPTTQRDATRPAEPWLIFSFVLAVLVVVVAATAIGIDTNGLTAITAATVAIVGAAVAAYKTRP